jgi:hypothetical protein
LIIWNNYEDYNSGSGTVADRSGNNNTAIVSGSTLVASASLGLEFNGTNNFFTYPEPVNATPTGSFTLQYYGTINFDSENRDYFCKNSFEDGWDTVATPYPEIVYRPVAGSDISLDGPIDGAVVKLITTTYNIDGTCELYIDDTLIVSKSSLIEPFNSGSAIPFTFGYNPQSDGNYFKGTFKDIILYNRILTEAEVIYNYTALSPSIGTTTTTTAGPGLVTNGLTIWNKFNGVTGSVWYDNSGNGNHALISGSSLALSGSLGWNFVPSASNENYLTYPASLVATPSSSFTLQFFGSPNADGNGQTLFGKTEVSSSTFSNGWYNAWNGLSNSSRRFYYYNNFNEEVVTPTAVPPATQSLYTFTITQGTGTNGGFYLNDEGTVTNFTSGQFVGFNTASAEPFTFGLDKSTGTTPAYGFYNGTISNILVYNRILSTAEIAQNYNYLFVSGSI